MSKCTNAIESASKELFGLQFGGRTAVWFNKLEFDLKNDAESLARNVEIAKRMHIE